MAHIVNINDIDAFISEFPTTPKRCAYTQECLTEWLYDPKDDITPGNKWTTFQVFDPTNDTVTHMMELLNQFGYLGVDIDYNDDGINVEHAFALCETNVGLKIVDSYIDQRSCSYRAFDFHSLIEFIISPTLDKWNNLFVCTDKIDPLFFSHDKEVVISYWYHDINNLQAMYRNGVKLW